MKTIDRLATLTEDVQGKLTRWKKGEVVRVTAQHRCWFVIEKLKKPRGPQAMLPGLWSMAGVYRKAIQFH